MPTSDESLPGPGGAEGRVENTIAVLSVSNLQASIQFYCEVLQFQLDWRSESDSAHIASVSGDGHAIMLVRREKPLPGCVWIGGSILVSVWDKVRSQAPRAIVQRPTNQPWALEMRIVDPDQNVLWFGDDPLENVAFGSEPADDQLPRP